MAIATAELGESGFPNGLFTDCSLSFRAPQTDYDSKIEFPPIPESEGRKERNGRKGEAKIARVIAPLVDVSRIVIYPKWSIEDMHGIDMTVYFTEESEKVPVDIQGKDNWNDYLAWISGTKAWLKRQHSQMSAQESYVKRRLVPINSGQSRKGILYQFNQGNEEIQERARFERSRTQLIPVFST